MVCLCCESTTWTIRDGRYLSSLSQAHSRVRGQLPGLPGAPCSRAGSVTTACLCSTWCPTSSRQPSTSLPPHSFIQAGHKANPVSWSRETAFVSWWKKLPSHIAKSHRSGKVIFGALVAIWTTVANAVGAEREMGSRWVGRSMRAIVKEWGLLLSAV